MSEIKVTTDNKPRPLIYACELTPAERAEFDYLNWPAIDAGQDSATFARYRGTLYDLGQFTRGNGVGPDSGLPDRLAKWDCHYGDSYFSAVLVRFVNDNDEVIMGLMTT